MTPSSLWGALTAAGRLPRGSIRGLVSRVGLSDLARHSSLASLASPASPRDRLEELRDRSILIATKGQLQTALALIELDGLARRVVLYPGDMPRAHIPSVIATAKIDALLSDPDEAGTDSYGVGCVFTCNPELSALDFARGAERETEWVLLTSGTTGVPKLTMHTLASLTGAITGDIKPADSTIWSTFYDIRRYGGLQIFLRAMLDGASLVLSDSAEAPGDFLIRAGAEGVTHISGTPSHWRRALMSPMINHLAPKYVRLSGEIVDQGILDNLRVTFPNATIVHAFASTEAGVGFDVRDGLAGFPAGIIGNGNAVVEMKIKDGSLRIRSARTATRYLGGETLADGDGYVDTGDLVDLRGDRYYFVGRRDGVINVGGAKVHPEEVEAVLNRHPRVLMSLVKSRKNPITGALVVAEVVLRPADEAGAAENGAALKSELIGNCRKSLDAYKVPATIRFVDALEMTTAGKLARRSA